MNKYEDFEYQMSTLGFYVVENFLDDKLCEKLKSLIVKELDLYNEFGTERSHLDRHHLHDLVCKYIDIAKLLEDEVLDMLLSKILGKHWIMYAFTGSSCPPKGTNYGGRIHVDCPRLIKDYTTNVGVLWALDDFTEENGATKVFPGSQNNEQIPSEELFNKFAVNVVVPKGSLVIFNARLVHSTGFNNTNHWRHALTMNICRPYMKQRMDWVRFIPENISSNLNNRARRIIGFDTRLPESLDQLFLPEEKRLYKANQE